MQELRSNIWDHHEAGHWIAITTNGFVKRNGEAVMGRGVALEAKQRFPDLPSELGHQIGVWGNRPFWFSNYKIVTFPVKHVWSEPADIELIRQSARTIAGFMSTEAVYANLDKLYIPRPGCGNGKLEWSTVRPVLEKEFQGDDRIIVVHL